ncbi:MAG: hypothetical protein AAF567_15105 [Actinomycetota bacterium]
MFFWFLGLSFALVLMVFDSPLLDYRLVMAGSVLPWLDVIWGAPWVMHSVLFPVLVMCLVMVLFRGRRLRQRRWLGLAIGLFMHLVLAATFTTGDIFWWPALGVDVGGAEPPRPGLVLGMVLEVVGLAVLAWLFRRLGLDDPKRRSLFTRSGHIDRSVLQA